MAILRISYIDKQIAVTRSLVAQDTSEILFNKDYLESLVAGREKSEGTTKKYAFIVLICISLLFFYVQDFKLPVKIFDVDLASVVGYGELVLLMSSLSFALMCNAFVELWIRQVAVAAYIEGDLMRKQAASRAALTLKFLPYGTIGHLIYNDPSDELFTLTSRSRVSLSSMMMLMVVMGTAVLAFLGVNIYAMIYVLLHPTLLPWLTWIIVLLTALCDIGGVLAVLYLAIKQSFNAQDGTPQTNTSAAPAPAAPSAGAGTE
ncbi:hypothetical protein [Hypericibacter sp.]|uniref:hypothetical protein n=1 Tax=Hypericibacter sp. TaxID=2705401 RepID=UPI003D6D9352